ncbi:UBP1-associated protein 2A [Hibiscus syriacus]|uniref:UBP1-associated protein 2A n=1 Tax=Hibiscus syriacus TaxID=106335 RepID=A0A6A2Z820_HIBSY|nr:UBP1-associated protein 2A-like [Hibiscus syriacus]XP_039018908.1 UBP1-associated protein 2A-like [Hibiscus syriacus]KAE8687282.1 UBP1-associated protein 2A [Hibiscus syriacus]
MAKKRKQRSSETQPTETTPDPQSIQEQEQQQQPQYLPNEDPNPKLDEEQQLQEVEEELELEVEVEEEVEEDDDEEEDEEDEETPNQTLIGSSNAAIQNGPKKGTDQEKELDDEPFEKLLEPFGKDQLITLIKKAVDKHPEFISSVREFADADPAHRKIFVHGLSWDTTAETLTAEFSKYGEIEDCKAVTDRVSGKSKGYAFILFKHRSGARRALKQPQKKIGNRTTSCQLASQGPVPAPPPTAPSASEYTQRKIFVSNVSADLDPGKLLYFFKQYGEIEEGPLGLDKQTGKPKGFAFFVYRSVESAMKALEEPHKNFEGHVLHCQKAIDGPKLTKGGNGGTSGGHHQQFHQHQKGAHQIQSHYHHAKKGKYSSAGSQTGHLMAPSGPTAVGFSPGVAAHGFNPAAAVPALNPALGQALNALLSGQGGLGLGNLLGGFGGAPVNQGAPAPGYGNQVAGGYGVQGGYQNPQMGQGGAGRNHPGGGAPYMGH